MKTEICEKLGIDVPIFAFTHCRDVVVAVSKAGGLGVLGAVGFTPEQLEHELDWIDEHIGDYPYAVDIVIPQKYAGIGETDPAKLEALLESQVPQEHREFAAKLLADHGVPEAPPEDKLGLLGWTEATAKPLLEAALKRPNVKMIANALGTPPVEIIKQIQASGRLVGALCGKVKQAKRHRDAGVDVIIAQGTEGGGHTGEIGSVVLWPQIIEAVAPTPVLAAGGIGSGKQMAAAMAMGAAGVWTGSIWLTVQEAEAQPAEVQCYLEASSEDTIRSRAFTGKPCRMLRNDWTEAWAAEDTPDPLGMPLQGLVTADAIRRTNLYASSGEAQKVAFNAVGQVVGQMKNVEKAKDVIYRMLVDYTEAVERLQSLMPE